MANNAIAVFSAEPSSTLPHPPWFYNGSNGNYPVDASVAKALGVTSAEVKRLPRSFAIFGKPIVGGKLSIGYFDGDFSELDAL
jgi:hypothetical protein